VARPYPLIPSTEILNKKSKYTSMEKKNSTRTKWLKIRITEEERQAIIALQRQSTSKSPSEYARKVVLNKPNILHYHDRSLDDFETSMLDLKRELKAISGNLNQMIRRLHTLKHLPGIQLSIRLNEEDKTRLDKKIETISTTIETIYELWLQESTRSEASQNPLPTTKKK